jgi:hypothetical protein
MWKAAAVVVLCCAVFATGIAVGVLLRSGSTPNPSRGPTMTVTASPTTTATGVRPAPELGGAIDDQFIATLRRTGIQIDDPQSAINTARNACAQLARGLGYTAVVASIGNPATLTGVQATMFVDDSELFYCPQFQEPESRHGE